MQINARNVNDAYTDGLWWLHTAGVKENSRNGPVLVSPEPVLTVYKHPEECVLFNAKRDANPYFHLMEALWMLAGRRDVSWPATFNPRMEEFSDDGVRLHGAYGYRWRVHFGFDQVRTICWLLETNPETRRAVLAMWSPIDDLGVPLLDLPCNTHVYFDLRDDKLNMTVCCRSNDGIWGAYGANAVHFSFLQQFIAGWLGKPIGVYRQFSNNFHLYTEVHGHLLPPEDSTECPYTLGRVSSYPLLFASSRELWETDLQRFLSDPYGDTAYHHPFFELVAAPMYASWYDRKTGKNAGLLALQGMPTDNDWRLACETWILRRVWREKEDGQDS